MNPPRFQAAPLGKTGVRETRNAPTLLLVPILQRLVGELMRTIEEYRGSCVCGIRLLVRIEFPTKEAADGAMSERRDGFESDCPSCGWRQAIAMDRCKSPLRAVEEP